MNSSDNVECKSCIKPLPTLGALDKLGRLAGGTSCPGSGSLFLLETSWPDPAGVFSLGCNDNISA